MVNGLEKLILWVGLLFGFWMMIIFALVSLIVPLGFLDTQVLGIEGSIVSDLDSVPDPGISVEKCIPITLAVSPSPDVLNLMKLPATGGNPPAGAFTTVVNYAHNILSDVSHNFLTTILNNNAYEAIIYALIVTYIAVISICFMLGIIKATPYSSVMALLKVSIVAICCTDPDFFWDNFVGMLEGNGPMDQSGLVYGVSAQIANATSAGINPITGVANAYSGALFDNVDNSIARLINPMFTRMFLAMFSMGMSVAILYAIAFVLMLITFVVAIFSTIKLFLIATIFRYILYAMMPIFLPFWLFNYTRTIFTGWLEQIINFSLQVALMFGFLGMFNNIFTQFILDALSAKNAFYCDRPYEKINGDNGSGDPFQGPICIKRDKVGGVGVESLDLYLKWWQFFPARTINMDYPVKPLAVEDYKDEIFSDSEVVRALCFRKVRRFLIFSRERVTTFQECLDRITAEATQRRADAQALYNDTITRRRAMSDTCRANWQDSSCSKKMPTDGDEVCFFLPWLALAAMAILFSILNSMMKFPVLAAAALSQGMIAASSINIIGDRSIGALAKVPSRAVVASASAARTNMANSIQHRMQSRFNPRATPPQKITKRDVIDKVKQGYRDDKGSFLNELAGGQFRTSAQQAAFASRVKSGAHQRKPSRTRAGIADKDAIKGLDRLEAYLYSGVSKAFKGDGAVGRAVDRGMDALTSSRAGRQHTSAAKWDARGDYNINEGIARGGIRGFAQRLLGRAEKKRADRQEESSLGWQQAEADRNSPNAAVRDRARDLDKD
jgi:type IV secretory pathway VirB6-like protein